MKEFPSCRSRELNGFVSELDGYGQGDFFCDGEDDISYNDDMSFEDNRPCEDYLPLPDTRSPLP